MQIFESIEEVKEEATRWLWTYNNKRPNMAIDGITPAMKLGPICPVKNSFLLLLSLKNGGITPLNTCYEKVIVEEQFN